MDNSRRYKEVSHNNGSTPGIDIEHPLVYPSSINSIALIDETSKGQYMHYKFNQYEKSEVEVKIINKIVVLKYK